MKTLNTFAPTGLKPDWTQQGKVRDTMGFGDLIVMVTTDRISAFDVILPRNIPHKGQVLNELSTYFLKHARAICPIWLLDEPHPNVAIGLNCKPIKVEMVVRGYLTGSAWREIYSKGDREICGIKLQDDMVEYQKFDRLIITPTTKAAEGHDLNISPDEILAERLVSQRDYEKMAEYSYKLFKLGTQMAAAQGLILVDTKYEFGLFGESVCLIDEVHTPDSSRYWENHSYKTFLANGTPPKPISKEFVRQWLIERGYKGETGQKMPAITDELVNETSRRYVELYEKLTGEMFFPKEPVMSEIEEAIEQGIKRIKARAVPA